MIPSGPPDLHASLSGLGTHIWKSTTAGCDGKPCTQTRLWGRQRRVGNAGLGPGPPVVRGGIEQEGPAACVGSFYQLFLSRMFPSLFR